MEQTTQNRKLTNNGKITCAWDYLGGDSPVGLSEVAAVQQSGERKCVHVIVTSINVNQGIAE